jgi:hypothetical protein
MRTTLISEWTVSTTSYLCECSNRECRDPIRPTRKEYEAYVRANLVCDRLNHETREIDRVLGEDERFATVEKIDGEGQMIVRATDPRQ